jgi:hypothetical protein
MMLIIFLEKNENAQNYFESAGGNILIEKNAQRQYDTLSKW